MSSAAKELRGDERARQSARQTAERAARKKQPKPRAKRGGPGGVRLDDDGDGPDDVSSETETEQEPDERPAQEQEVPLAELVSVAQRISRKDTQESFEMVSAAADRGVVALEDSAELPGPGEGWERVESRDAEDRPTYSDSLLQMLAALPRARKFSIVIPKSDFLAYWNIPNLRLNGEDDYLSTVNTVLGKPAPFQPSIGARIMTLLIKGADCTEFRADYCPLDDGDKFVVIWLDAGRNTNVSLHMYHVDIPDSRRDAARTAFNIPSRLANADSPSIRLL